MALPEVNGIFRIHTKEVRYTQDGTPILTLNVVASSKYKTKAGQEKEDTCWIGATAFGKQAEIMNTYLQEKQRVFLRGELKQDTWTDQQGAKKSKHTIKINSFEFIEKANQSTQNEAQQQNAPQPNHTYATNQQGAEIPTMDINEENIPFVSMRGDLYV